MTVRVFLCLISLSLISLPAAAHHPFSAEYDWKKPISIAGKVTMVEWANPHVHLYVDEKHTDGVTKNWDFEMGSVNALTNVGWTRDTLKMGDNVTVDAWFAKAKANAGSVKSVKLPEGRELPGASSIVDANASDKK